MEVSVIEQIIRGKLEKVGLQVDDILITENEKHRSGNDAVFHIRKMHGGLYKSIGYLKMNVNTGDIAGIAETLTSLDRLIPESQFQDFFSQLKAEEAVLRKHYAKSARRLELFYAENVKTFSNLLFPEDYINRTLRSQVQKTVKPRHELSFTKDAITLSKEHAQEITERLDLPLEDQTKKTIRNLASYSAKANDRKKILEEDVNNATDFLRAIYGLALQWFSDPYDEYFVLTDEEISKLTLAKVFYQWYAFKRLPSRYQTPKLLILLLIQNACIHYALDNSPKNLEEFRQLQSGK